MTVCANCNPAQTEPLYWDAPIVLPPFWQGHTRLEDGARYVAPALGLRVIISLARQADGLRWLHLSASHESRLPRWRELKEIKEIFIGPNRYAYQVFPPEDKYVNLHPRTLHMFHCLDGPQLPEFSGVIGGCRTL